MYWPNLLGACFGLALGSALNHYMMNLFGPPLIAEFGWTKAQFALVGSLGMITVFVLPFAGRFTDRYGPRASTAIGFIAVPSCYLALSFMSGDIFVFYAILTTVHVFGIFATTFVFTRVVVERFDIARGIALACMLSGPPLVGALAVQLVGDIIQDEGWRAGYRALALISALGGVVAILLIGHTPRNTRPTRPQVETMSWSHFREIVRKPVFLLLAAGMFFVNLPQVIVSSQVNIMLMENGATAAFATTMVSLYAISVVIGRFISGFALDRVPPHFVAIVALGLPCIGYLSLASSFDGSWVIIGSMALIGLAQGAETDVSAILTSRKFAMQHYSFIFSLLMGSMMVSAGIGAGLLSFTLHLTDKFDMFLVIAAAATLVGAACFFLTGRFGREAVQDGPDGCPLPTPALQGDAG